MELEQRRNRYLLKNTVIFAIGNFGSKFINFFLVPLYTNILSTKEYGVVDLVYTIGMLAIPVITLNVGEAIMRFCLDKDAKQNKIMSIGLCLLVLSTLIGIFLLPICLLFDDIAAYAKYVVIYTITYAYSQVFLCYLRGKELLVQYSIGNIIYTFFIAIFNVIFLLILHKGIAGYLTAYILANIVTAVYAFFSGNILQVIRNFNIDWKLCREMTKYSVVLIPNSFMWWIMNSSDRIMITAMVGVAANGIYAVAYKIPTFLSTISNIFNVAWSYSAIRENESSDKEEYSNSVYDRMLIITIITSMGLLMIMKPFLKVYVENSYYTAWKYVPFLLVGFVFMTLGSFIATTYTVNKDSRGFLFSGMAGAITNLILNFLLIPVIGATGAAIATCISYIIVYIYRVNDTKKYLKLDIFRKRHIAGVILLVVMMLTTFWDSMGGQILLIIEFSLTFILFKDFWKAIIMGVIYRLRSRRND